MSKVRIADLLFNAGAEAVVSLGFTVRCNSRCSVGSVQVVRSCDVRLSRFDAAV